jgi:hypothetical protein
MGLIASIYEQMVSREFYNYESLYAQYNASGWKKKLF